MNEAVSVIIPCSRKISDEFIQHWNEIAKHHLVLEVLLVLNGTNAKTNINRLNLIKDGLSFSYLQSPKGSCIARNFGAANASGMYIHFLDDDDFILDGFYSSCIKLLEKDNSVAGAACDVFILPDGDHQKRYIAVRPLDLMRTQHLLIDNVVGVTSCVVIRRDYFQACGGFDEKISARQDYHLWLRLSLLGDFRRVNIPLVNWHEHRKTKSLTNQQGINRHKAALQMIDSLRSEICETLQIQLPKRKIKSSNYKYLGRIATRIGVAGYRFRLAAFFISPTLKGLALLLPDQILVMLRRILK